MLRTAMDTFGRMSYWALLVITFVSLVRQPPILRLFLGFLMINMALNMLLRTTLREKRPHPLDHVSPETPMYYGMPSLHAQNTGYCMAFLFYTRMSPMWYSICGILGGVAVIHRYILGVHFLRQLLVGFLVGILVGVFARRIYLDT